ncbi:DUF2290 domain-containing protein [Thalassospira sp. A40-3]|uniref:DUF2290 domain-containing protein n=1 Tax=Thalassospira sp. A40-3 TaxID=2785908 RepID=UPI0018CE8674|nr:DUF2290 domain-containing protein [Thalassospira sp. A40-3]QPO13233.1 DUF2290 domain-containing protein [Thalassospira sp. A40-3]
MNERELSRSILAFWDAVTRAGISLTISNSSSLTCSEEFIATAMLKDVSMEELYLCGLRNSDYNVLLKDRSFFQFTIKRRGGLRYAYYPNPFFGADEKRVSELEGMDEYVQEGLLTQEEFLAKIAELRANMLPPVLRFEYDPQDYVEMVHPSSHFHLGFHSENRWAVERVLSPLAFGLHVTKMYYSAKWSEAENKNVGGQEITVDDELINAKASCPVVPEELFSQREREQFYFA